MFNFSRRARENMWAYLFIGPQMIGLTLFIIGPIIFAFAISFTEWDIGSTPTWLGLENYTRQLSDSVFWKVVRNTSFFALINIPLTMIGSLIIALMLNQNIKGKVILRTAYFMPVVTSSVAVALVWTWMYNPDFGLINSSLGLIGIEGPGWLSSLKWALPSIAFMTIWQGIGYNMILFLAGLQGISKQLYEAAVIDGANGWQKFWKITFPLLSPTIFFVLVMLLISSFQIFNEPYMMTKGGPADASNVFVLHIYDKAFQFFKMGEASAIAFILFIIILVFTLLQFKFSKWVNYDA
ncbi:carbohydrate ABC transporter permease [Gracilibacillus alcaliphilus]|uniref:carbohydrate ABC transporter permease n=1 Tax=Gracilibacillus alcaliphilus TaxID=1401441 RepID=UPI00195EF1C4|nr:sugar ABC transporter permease [Gracilibacillus alcaliphilus]MBM7676819.1 multiple sugar transport system permease protein [Gracilibacillus alcaliphilus]